MAGPAGTLAARSLGLRHKRSAEVAVATWSRAAWFYDLQLPSERAALDAAVELAGAGAEDWLLDVATGTGGFLRRLARRPSRPHRAVGVDASAAMLARVPKLPPGWEVRQADACELPFPDASFDVATACYLLHTLSVGTRRGVLGEIARVLRPGGRLVTVTPAEPRGRAARALAAPLIAVARRSSGLLAGLRPLDPTHELVWAGFAVRTARSVAGGYPSICVLAERVEAAVEN
ncbi:MAG TPA: class I SAM-dependent methyltransferase [Solirubrobacterales bacterium]|nr:class I SAM-dependent methyltransferase [Solirubrobacterales bacterium]